MKEEWLDSKPVGLFLDTSILKSCGFNFSSPGFQTVQKAISNGDITLLWSSISEGEFLKHCEEILTTAHASRKKLNIFTFIAREELSRLSQKIDSIDAKDVLRNFKTEFNVKDIDGVVDWKTVFKKYFRGDGPFSRKNKKAEFPDAFNIELIQNSEFKRIIVVSEDGDYFEGLKHSKEVTTFRSLSAFTNKYLMMFEPAQIYRNAFESFRAEIETQMSSWLADSSEFEVDDWEAEIVAVEVESISVESIELESIDDEEHQAHFEVWFHIEVAVDLSCPVVVWDSVDREDIHLGTNAKVLKHAAEVQAQILILLDDDGDALGFELDDYKVYTDQLEIPHEWTNFLDYEEGHT